MKNCLILLTKKFPYDTGEEFIANELPVIAMSFDRVVVISTSVSDCPVQTRSIPQNAEAHFIRASKVSRALPFGAARSFTFVPRGYYSDEERREVKHSLLKRMFLAYFLSKENRVEKEAADILSGVDLNRFDGVTFYSYWFYDTALAALNLKNSCGAARVRAVSRAHGYDLYTGRNPVHYLPLRPYLLGHLDAVYPCSDDGSGYLKEKYPRYADKVSTAYLGTLDAGPGPEKAGPAFHVVSCCHIAPVKRVELLARSLSELSGSGVRLKWTHLGGGEGLQALRDYAAENLGFMECDFPGEVSNEKLLDFYRKNHVDCFVNTSSSEGLPVSIMEACSFGIPVIATDVGGTGEIVKDGVDGCLLDAGFAPADLAGKLLSLCRMDPERRGVLRAGARNVWQKHFNAEINYARFAKNILPDESNLS